MKKKIFDKLRKNKVCKTVLALSLALALLLSGAPIAVKANTIQHTHERTYWAMLKTSSDDVTSMLANTYWCFESDATAEDVPIVAFYISVVSTSDESGFYKLEKETELGKRYTLYDRYYLDNGWEFHTTHSFTSNNGMMSGLPFNGYVNFEFIDCYGVDVYLSVNNGTYEKVSDQSYGNATEQEWIDFVANTRDFIGYHYVTENGATLWKEMRFNHVVYPYWEQDADGTRKLMIYAPYEQTIYMTKDVGRYVDDGIYDYYISTIELTDEWCIQPYAWYEDYQPDLNSPEKVFEVIVPPYGKVGYGANPDAERYLIDDIHDCKEDAIKAYQADEGIIITPTPDPLRPISPIPSPTPLPPTDDSESMGFADFIKQFENLFNASGNMWLIMYYCFAFLPPQIVWLIWSAVQIFLAVMVIKWIRG